jgi:hypothetical protein
MALEQLAHEALEHKTPLIFEHPSTLQGSSNQGTGIVQCSIEQQLK